ncbi:hypothetical protein ACT7C4_01035 [Bacillus pacificus]
MKWKQEDTIKVYEHYFDEEKTSRLTRSDAREYDRSRKRIQRTTKKTDVQKKTKLTLLETEKEMELDEDIQDLLDGLE